MLHLLFWIYKRDLLIFFCLLFTPLATDSKHRLLWCCMSTLRWSIAIVVLPRLVLLAFTICQPLVLTRFLEFLEDAAQPNTIGYALVAAYGIVYFGIAVSQALYWHRNARTVSMLRSVLVTAVFSKLTVLNLTVASDEAAVTLMSSDVSDCRNNLCVSKKKKKAKRNLTRLM